MSDESATAASGGAKGRISFTVQTIDCIACTPVFRRSLAKVSGVTEVKELPITNKVIVTFDPSKLEREKLQAEVVRISRSSGFGDKVIFHR